MEKVAIISRDNEIKEIEKELTRFSFKIDSKNPDFVISHGGDGTFLISERKYPGIPKLLVKNSQRCYKCKNLPISKVLAFIKIGKSDIENLTKLEAELNGNKLIAVNDIVIRNYLPIYALRFSLEVNNKIVEQELIGDGLIISTAFGSTAYFYSVAKEVFKEGIGIAFMNLHNKENSPLILNENVIIKIKILRGDGVLACDNNPEIIMLKEGDEIIIKKSAEFARMIII